MKKQLIQYLASKLHSFGYVVYISKNGEYGFYTDGFKVVSFGGHWNFCVDFSGNYKSTTCGTGWCLHRGKELVDITEEKAARFLMELAPQWATRGERVTYTTPEQHLKTYGASSGYVLFSAEFDSAGKTNN